MNGRRPGVDLRSVIELHLVDCPLTGRSSHLKAHRGRLRVHVNGRRAGWQRSIAEAILKPGIDVLDELIQLCIGIFVHRPVLPVGLHHNPFQEPRARPCAASPLVGRIDRWYDEELVVCADDGQQRSVLCRCIGDWVKIVQECGKCRIAEVRDGVKVVHSAWHPVPRVIVETVIEPGARIERDVAPITCHRNPDRALHSIVHAVNVVGELSAH